MLDFLFAKKDKIVVTFFLCFACAEDEAVEAGEGVEGDGETAGTGEGEVRADHGGTQGR